MDPLTTVGAGLTVLGSKELLTKLLGPSADYVGGEIKNLVERCNINLDNVFRIALHKLGSRADEPGVVNPRVLKRVFDEARLCDDPLMAEYLGGVLASSKGDIARDDRGTFYLNEINALSTYQLRTHYLIYAVIVRSQRPYDQDLSYWYQQDTISVAIPESGYLAGMEYSTDEPSDDISFHSFLGLEMKGLCERGIEVIEPQKQSDFDVPFRFYWPTRYGFELFLWGLGLGNTRVSSYFDLETDIALPHEPPFTTLAIELGQRYFH
ncbi:hypothetical protein [Rubinisphaera italica]|uniref:Uncharacterized protein n=1 Tax=Rubinisphaera italica TaxID=2527969 RepID=A0A5C5XN66_9PLAN|nr:hypothetical protein [Rubinisphaera italica]TWT63921.1 hypothetical protein Pan54_46800 [Rubinisphaera italica]